MMKKYGKNRKADNLQFKIDKKGYTIPSSWL